jgi:hypothetical protein
MYVWSDNSITNINMPYSKVDTAPGNKKGSLLIYGTVDRKETGGFKWQWQQAASIVTIRV